MSAYYYGAHHQASANAFMSNQSHAHHGGRSKRTQHSSSSRNSHRQPRGSKAVKEIPDTASIIAFRTRFEAGRSFDLDDDMEFCPGLLTDDDLNSIHSASDRSSLSSGSPDSSPLQQQIQPTQQVTPIFSLPSSSNNYGPSTHHVFSQARLHQPAPGHKNNAIPIVNPSTGMRVSSPPLSISPARLQHVIGRRW